MSTFGERARVVTAPISDAFNRMSDWTIRATGTVAAFLLALTSVLVWLAFAPIFGFGNTNYQLTINTSTTIVTFLMIFLVQNGQNRAALRDEERKAHDEEQAERLARMEDEHGAMLAELRDVLADLHSHTTCVGHTTIISPANEEASLIKHTIARANAGAPPRTTRKARMKA